MEEWKKKYVKKQHIKKKQQQQEQEKVSKEEPEVQNTILRKIRYVSAVASVPKKERYEGRTTSNDNDDDNDDDIDDDNDDDNDDDSDDYSTSSGEVNSESYEGFLGTIMAPWSKGNKGVHRNVPFIFADGDDSPVIKKETVNTTELELCGNFEQLKSAFDTVAGCPLAPSTTFSTSQSNNKRNSMASLMDNIPEIGRSFAETTPQEHIDREDDGGTIPSTQGTSPTKL